MRTLALLLLLTTFACDSSTGPEETPTRDVGVVLNSVDISLTVFSVDDPEVRTTIGLGPDGSPVSLAARGETVVVPLGSVPALAVVDLAEARVVRTVPLPSGSGATGAAFLSDSVVVVANPDLGTVSPVNVRSGQRGADVAVGLYPQGVLTLGDTVLIVNAQLGPDFQPVGAGTLSVLAGSPLQVVRTVTLSGTNPRQAVLGPGGRIYVIHSGRFGEAGGSLSVLDRSTLTELAHHPGFGSFPGSLAVDAAGRVHVAGFGIGVLVWDAGNASFLRGLSDPVAPGSVPSTPAVALDGDGRLWALAPECAGPSVAYRLGSGYATELEVPVGSCPFALEFTQVAGAAP